MTYKSSHFTFSKESFLVRLILIYLHFFQELQLELEEHQQDFQDIISASTKRRGSTSSDEGLSSKINYITDKWYSLSRFVSEQYQVLSLSLHFTEASEHVLTYLQNIEEKLKSDIPDDVKEKIQQENEKAKVRSIC